jgi:hypothetical protein
MAAAGVALGVAVAPPAHSDDAQFLADMHALDWGNDNGDAGTLYVGHWICVQLEGGKTPAETAQEFARRNRRVDPASAMVLVVLSQRDICPNAASDGGVVRGQR